MKTTSFKLMALSAAVLLLASSCNKPQGMQMSNSQYELLEVDTVSRTVWQSYSASLAGRQDVDVYPQVSGTIVKVCVSEGAKVQKSQLLFVIDRVPYEAALAKAEADAQSARAAVANAAINVDNKRQLCSQGIVSEVDLKTAENELSQREAQLSQAKALLADARNNLAYTEVRSPVSGSAGMIKHRVGALVGPTMTSPLVSVSDNSEMYAYFSMTEKQMLSITRGGGDVCSLMPKVQLQLADGSDYGMEGNVDAVSGIIDRSTGALSMRAVFHNPDGLLRSGGQAVLRVPITRQGCIVVPQEATFELQDKVMVYKVVDGKTKAVQIQVLGISDGKEYIVESGLSVGDVIIAKGAGLLREGVTVDNKTDNK
ncbi:MAG: efflux RND transporter periplasmic adaptor subunit [Muribaculaceae bacterium]